MSARLHINPRYRDLLHAQGLTTARAFLDLSGVIRLFETWAGVTVS